MSGTKCRFQIFNCIKESKLVAGSTMMTDYEFHVNGDMTYTITDFSNRMSECGISHFEIVSDFSDLSKFTFCPLSVVTSSNNTARLDAALPDCLKFGLDTARVYDYKF
jgi:hypothetical protein